RSSLATTTSSFVLSSRRRHTRCYRDLSSDVCSSDLDDSVTPAGGDPIGAKTVVWSAGVRPTDPAGGESPRSGSHRLETDQYLRGTEERRGGEGGAKRVGLEDRRRLGRRGRCGAGVDA